MAASRRADEGFVLFSVIWIAGLIAVIATTFAIATRLHIKSQASLAQAYQAEAEADGIVRLIGARLAQARFIDGATFALPMDGSVVSCEGGNKAQVSMSLQDQAGLIDLNQTSPATLRSIIGRLGVAQAEAVARALVDYRDQDQTAFDGSGDEISLVAGGPGPKNAAFQSVDEIAQVIPESMADLSPLSSLFTVYSLQQGIDPAVAPPLLKAFVDASGMSSADNGRIPTALSPRKAFAIDVAVEPEPRVTFRRVAVVTLLRLPERPFAILEWRQGDMVRPKKSAMLSNTACKDLQAN